MLITFPIFYFFIFFILSICGIFFHQTNILKLLIFLELSFLSIIFIFFFISIKYNEINGTHYILYLITLNALETALGLALFILYYKKYKTIEVKNFILF